MRNESMTRAGRQRRAFMRAAAASIAINAVGLPLATYVKPLHGNGESRSARFGIGRPYGAMLGDSVSSGNGAGRYCGPHFRSRVAAGALMAEGFGLEWINLARSGAQVSVSADNSIASQVEELAAIIEIYGFPQFISFSIGANDMRVMPAIVQELLDGTGSLGTTQERTRRLANARTNFVYVTEGLSRLINQQRPEEPQTQVLLIDYPFRSLPHRSTGGLSSRFVGELTEVFGQLNDEFGEAIAMINQRRSLVSWHPAFHRVDIASSFAREPERLLNFPSPGSLYMDSVYLMTGNEEGSPAGLFHPNARGHEQMAKAMMASVLSMDIELARQLQVGRTPGR